MSKFRDKLQTFIFGLSVGLLIACLFFIFKLDDYFRKIDFSIMSQKKNISEEVVKPKTEEEKEKPAVKKNEAVSPKKTNTLSTSYSVNDSLYAEGENYHVLKEEMISVKNVYVKVLTPKEKTNSTDSLIASLAGVTTTDEKDFFMIEFWKTPLNSKGYKMTRNRLLIYGYNENPDVAVIKLNDNYFLKNNGLVYKLNYSSDFKPLERIDDATVAGKFN
ncbi:MAG: hypothetical protein ACXVPN_15670 [Bacteroidia bacterium]